MTLIQITETIFVNPESIDAVEFKILRAKPSVTVFVKNRSYKLKVPLREFLEKLKVTDMTKYQQFFVG